MEYHLQQTGQEVQEILNQAPTTEENLQNEITRSTNKDNELEAAIENEQTRAEGVESGLQTAIDNEVSRAEGVEGNLQTSITNEKNRAEGVEGGLRTDVDAIEGKIPTGASDQNKLATEGFVNSSISTNTADFKGTYNSIEELQTEVPTATANDYAFVISTDASGNTVYNRYKYVAGEGWQFEYALNNSSFTAAQWSAINSAITAALVAKLNGLPTAAELTQRLNAIIDSVATEKTRAEGIEAGLRTDVNTNAAAIVTEKNRAQGVEGTLQTSIVAEENRAKAAETLLQQNINAEATLRDNGDDALQAEIDEINTKIPTQASASNQLADKAFVNSSIATNTGEFKGTYNSLSELQAVTNVNANDYGFVIATDGTGNTVYNRYKYVTGQGWVFEYALNNSSFTAAQWGAINSGITAALAAKINGLPDIDALNAMFAAITSKIPANASSSNKLVDYAQLVAALAAKQDTLIFDNVPTDNSNNPVKSGGVYSAIATVTAAVVGLQSSKQDVLTFDQYPTPGSNNPVRSTGIYSSIENAVAPKANQTDLDNAVIRISTNEVDIAQLQAAYRGLTQNDVVPVAPTDTWPVANPQENVIYRVADRTNTPPQYYTDYMWNGTVMVLMAQYNNAIDSRPKKNSQNLVTSGGVFDNMGALDVSELNATENPHTPAIYADLSAALAAIQTDYQKGGMSIKFIQGTVQSSDNNYVQYRLMAQLFTTDTTKWAVYSNGVYIYNPEFIAAWTDKDKKILIAVENDGNVLFGAGVPRQIIDYINEKIAELSLDEYEDIVTFLGDLIEGDKTLQELLSEKVDKEEDKSLIPTQYIQEVENPEYFHALTDNNDKITEATKKDGGKLFGGDVEVRGKMSAEAVSAKEMLLNGKRLSPTATVDVNSIIEDPENRLEIKTDAEDKIISYRKTDGTLVENVGVETPVVQTNSLKLTPEGLNELEQDFKDSGFNPGGAGDFSEKGIDYPISLPFPVKASKINFIVARPITEECLNPFTGEDEQSGYMEYYDYYGNYFKKPCTINTQGQTSQRNKKKNIGLDIDDGSEIMFGDWVPQDSFHIKAHPNDITGTRLISAYRFVELIYQAIGGRPFDAINNDSDITYTNSTGNIYADYKNNVLCHPDGFAVEIYFNGEWWGLGMLQLKKHRKNYGMDKKDYESVLLDMNETLNYFWGGKDTIGWTVQGMMDIKNPKKMIAIDGSEWDEGKEIIGSNTVFKKSFTLNSIPSGFTGGTVSVAIGDSTTIQVNIPSTATIEDIRDALIAQTYPNFTCTKSGSKTIIFEYTGGGNTAPDVTITCNGSVPLVFTSKVISVQYNSGNKDMKNTAKTKKVIEDIADSYNIVHSLESELDNNAAAKAKFEELFDKDACEAVYIINCFLNNGDSIKKNTLWMKYKNGKIAPAPYDLDSTYGGGVTGLGVSSPGAGLWNGPYATSAWPLSFIWKFYSDNIVQKYAELRRSRVISIAMFEKLFKDLYEQQSFNAIEREIEKWTPVPYRDAGTLNSAYWRKGSYGADTTWKQWDKDTEYQVNDCVFVVGENNINAEAIKGERLYGVKYTCIAPNQNQCPVDIIYDNFPYTGGMYDSIKRQIKWVEEQIRLCDIKLGYSE